MTNGSDRTTASAAPTRSVGDSVSAGFTLHAGQPFGPFAIVGPLGSGGMGEVYEAEELESGRHVALKVLSRSLGTVDRARFLREGRLAAAVSHPHTIYIYGTDEIQGVPVIAMELAAGGTLKDLVKKRGFLPPAQAVDAILQVVAGLEAAADAGVLHRDIKPSNCFVNSDGTVKVGDFGLSISTLTTDERSLTMLGTVLGTPAFASPEQMRGDDLDVRSDIYSVGATLYDLLTGRPPFEDTNILRLVTLVAQEMPASPRAIRQDIPNELADVTMRCLAKRPSDRYASYDDLRAALEPFSSAAPRPASPGIRFIAGIVDTVILWALALPVLTWLWEPFVLGQREDLVQASLVTWVVDIAYFGFPEGRWGRSLAKQLFGLRVVDAARQRPGIPRGLARAALWTVGISAPMLAYGYAIAPLLQRSQNTALGGVLGFSFPLLSLTLSIAMFVTARRGNGYAGLHDLATGTRVVMKHGTEGRARTVRLVADQPVAGGSARIGPYVMLEERPLGGDHVQVGYDDRLRRRVWIRQAHPGEPPVPVERRTLSRSTRLRWLSGRRTDDEAWDAYEALDGLPLVTWLHELGLGRPHPWSAVRFWLLDLAAEIHAGLAGGSLPSLTPGHVWITSDGRARLLDWPAGTVTTAQPGEPAPRDRESTPPDFATAQAFLYEIGARSLDPSREPESRSLHVPLPLGARSVLDRLERGAFESADALLAEAAAIGREPATLGRGRRIGHLAFCSLPQLIMIGFLTGVLLTLSGVMTGDPDLIELTECLQRLDNLNAPRAQPRRVDEIRAFELYVAARHRARIEDPATWSPPSWSILRFNSQLRDAARRAVAAHPEPAMADVQAAETIVRPYLEQEKAEAERMRSPLGILAIVLLFGAAISVIAAGLGLLSALIFRGGLALQLFGAAVVTSHGHDVSRLRALWRALAAWSPTALGALGIVLAEGRFMTGRAWMIAVMSSMALLLIGAVYAVRHPDRGLQDRIAGTRLVPR